MFVEEPVRLLAHGKVLALRQAERLARRVHELRAALAMRLGRPGDLGNSLPDQRPRNDELRLARGGLGFLESGRQRGQVVTVHRLHAPFLRTELLCRVLALRLVRHRIEGDVVGVVKEDEVIELVVPGKGDCLLRHAFLQAAVAREADDVVIEDGVARGVELCRSHLL